MIINALMILVKIILSIVLIGVCYMGFNHGGIAQVLIGLAAAFMSLFIWAYEVIYDY
jgi:hypothetical protein